MASTILLVGCSACTPPVLIVRSATVEFPAATPGAAGTLRARARYTGMTLDPERSVRLDVARSARWLFLRPVPGPPGAHGVDGEEHGYTFALDPAAREVMFTEPESVGPGANPVTIVLEQDRRRACTQVWFTEAKGGWTFTEDRDRQAPCPRR